VVAPQAAEPGYLNKTQTRGRLSAGLARQFNSIGALERSDGALDADYARPTAVERPQSTRVLFVVKPARSRDRDTAPIDQFEPTVRRTRL
jgi:hypothetical protein